MSKEEKSKLELALAECDKKYGKGSVFYGQNKPEEFEVISTGSLALDIATGIGGIPIGDRGRIIELFGWESGGKSTLSQTIIGNYQKLNKKKALLVDGENSLDSTYAANLGVKLDDLLITQLDEEAGEGAFEKTDILVESGEIGLVVIDSYNSLQPKKVLEGEYAASDIGIHAKLIGKTLVRNNILSVKHGCTFIYIGQLREKPGVMHGSPEVTQGGNALKFYAHMRMRIGRSVTKDNSVMDGEEKLGNLTKVEVIKNKLSPPFKKAEFDIIYGQGVDRIGELVSLGSDYEVFKKWGDSITYNETKSTIKEFRTMLIDNDDFKNEIDRKIRDKAGIK